MQAVEEKMMSDLSSIDPFVWTHANNITLYNETYDPKRYPFQVEILRSRAKKKTVKKGVQLGITRTVMNQIFHGLITDRYPHGALYGHPSDREVTDFVKSRFNPMITENYEAIGRFVQDTDTVNLKQINGKFLYMRGFRPTTNIGGVLKESSRLSSITVDIVIRDEKDLMDQSMAQKANERMDGSDIKEEFNLSKPSIPDYGIDRDYKNSSMGYWVIKCFHCGTETSPDREFPESVRLREDGTGYLCCKKCKREIKPTDPGFWIHENRELIGINEGFWVSQLLSPTIDPGVILNEYENPPGGDLGQVKRRRLGLAHIDAHERLTTQAVYNCCGNEPMLVGFAGPSAIGVDVGKKLHYVIGQKIGDKSYKVFKIGQADNWEQLRDIEKKFGVKHEVQDSEPEYHKSREHQKSAPHEVFLCQYSDILITGDQWNLDSGIVKVNRTETLDRNHSVVTGRGGLILPRAGCDEMKLFAEQMANVARVPIQNETTGAFVNRYICVVDSINDHYRHAFNYFQLAADRMMPVGYGGYDAGKQTRANTPGSPY